MTRDDFDIFCAALPGAVWADPAEGKIGSWTVGGKMFACTGSMQHGISVKTDSIETAQMLIETGVATRAPYFHKSWIRLDWDAQTEEIEHRIRMSHALIAAKLTRKQKQELGLV